MKIEPTDPRLVTLMRDWEKLERARYIDPSDIYAKLSSDRVSVTTGTKYMRLDTGSSGAFMLDRETGAVCCIKAYGTIDRRKVVGYLDDLTGQKLFDNRFWDLSRQKEAK